MLIAPMLLHAGLPAAPHDLWRTWRFEPVTIVALAAGAAVYAVGARRLRAHAGGRRGVPRWRRWCWGSGLAAVAAALLSPLDAAGDALFAAHMVQHLVLIVVAAPLLVLGAPLLPALWAFPAGARRTMGRWWKRSRALRAVAHAAGEPMVVWGAHVAALWLWHLPLPYQAALESDVVHALEHASFLGTAVLFWWVVLHPVGRRRLGWGAAVLYVTAAGMQSAALGAILAFARTPWYPVQETAALAWGLTPLEDQQLAGMIMWIPAGVAYLVAAGWCFVEWMRAGDGRRWEGADLVARKP